jgi:hypothetical protein
MTTKNDWNNIAAYYEYDEFGRLHFERDHDKNVIKKINYNYRGANTTWYNSTYSMNFIKKCSGEPTQMFYTVPAGTYSSVTGPDEPVRLAQQDALQNGQLWVQQQASCDYTPIPVTYVKDGSIAFTATYENLVTHVVYTFNFSAATGGAQVHLGDIPKGRYNVTISTSSTAFHSFILGTTAINGTTSATFSNVSLLLSWQPQIIINGNQ